MLAALLLATTLRFTVPAVQNDTTSACVAGDMPLMQLDSLRLVCWFRVRGWAWCPVGWYSPPLTVVAIRAVPWWRAGLRDSFQIAMPMGRDSVGTFAVQAHNPRGWSCPGNGVTLAADGVTR